MLGSASGGDAVQVQAALNHLNHISESELEVRSRDDSIRL